LIKFSQQYANTLVNYNAGRFNKCNNIKKKTISDIDSSNNCM